MTAIFLTLILALLVLFGAFGLQCMVMACDDRTLDARLPTEPGLDL
jgi:hypothetical protein